jgi:hypothetical protein
MLAAVDCGLVMFDLLKHIHWSKTPVFHSLLVWQQATSATPANIRQHEAKLGHPPN